MALKSRSGFGLIRSFGWKRNLLAILVCFLICRGLDHLRVLLTSVHVLSDFDLELAVLPMFGFLQGIWGVIGCLLSSVVSLVELYRSGVPLDIFESSFFIVTEGLLPIVYSALPAILWYSIPLKGEKRARYPRLDTAVHVLKYYLIMTVSVAVVIVLYALGTQAPYIMENLVSWAAMFTQYQSVALIVGIPVVIIVSVVRYRTITINERMVLAFLFIGVIASVIGAYLLYRTSYYLKPALFTDYETLVSQEVLEWTAEVEEAFNEYISFWNWYYVMLAVILNCLLLIEMLFMRSIEKKVTKPILHLADTLEQYAAHEEGSLDPEAVRSRCKPYRQGYGEVSSLTSTCVNLVDEIESYTENLKTVTAEKERIGAELDVASKIQRDMLPGVFPPFPDRKEIDLYASMTPAKEVGGDFYDFYLIDQDHLALTIADVSGKGVPASLFMVISKTLLKNQAQSGGSPREILTYVNHLLCQNNDSFMFCTAWLAILELSTGRLVASNAGHEYPVIRRQGGAYELLMDEHDPALGVLDGLRYHEYELQLEPGDCIFEYTDGVTETSDEAYEQFGEDRIVQVLNEDPEADPEQQIGKVYEAIHAFVKEAPQFDDITMLAFRYAGPNAGTQKEQERLVVPAKKENLGQVMGFVEERLQAADCSEDDIFVLTLAVEEIFVNIAGYAYDGEEGDAAIDFSFDPETRFVEIVFTDKGMPFDPISQPDPDITLKPGEMKSGGLGIYLVRKMMDEAFYKYEAGRNVLTIRKHILTPEEALDGDNSKQHDEIMNLFRDYVTRMKEIRALSTPDLEDVANSNQYSSVLTDNFSRIGELAQKNSTVINEIIRPLMDSEEEPPEEMQDLLRQFDEMLVRDDDVAEVDFHLSEVIEGILNDRELRKEDAGDENSRVIAMARKVKTDYFQISTLTRFSSGELEEVRKRAIENRNQLAENLKKGTFETLNDEAKSHVLHYSMMGVLLYESNLYPMPTAWWEEALSILEESTAVLKDPFYRQQLPDFDWTTYEFRIYYYGSFFAHSYIPEDIAKRVYAYADKAVRFLETGTDNEEINASVGRTQAEDLRCMASVLAHETPAREACDYFYRAYEERDPQDYSVAGIDKNLDTPSLYMRVARITGMELNEQDYDRYHEIERSVLNYLYRIPKKSSTYLKCVTLLTNLPMYFQEVPGGMTMEEFCVNAFAAIHPPTYVHSNMVARMAECMAKHLIDRSPEVLVGFPGCETEEQVLRNRETIVRYTYHAGLCHDLGKLLIVDTISMYGRALFDDEFAMIKNHPEIGAYIASRQESTRPYVDVIRGHHLWYDGSRGYPEGVDTSQSPYKVIIDLITAADCLDAATDTVGRSYQKGKTFEDVGKEIQAEAGTRFAPFLVALFRDPDLRSDIKYLLQDGRKKLYQYTYQLLK